MREYMRELFSMYLLLMVTWLVIYLAVYLLRA
jgi:hypothetical protein